MRKNRFAKKRWDMQRDEDIKQGCNEMRREAKKEVAIEGQEQDIHV